LIEWLGSNPDPEAKEAEAKKKAAEEKKKAAEAKRKADAALVVESESSTRLMLFL
jgi:hypothetical protein